MASTCSARWPGVGQDRRHLAGTGGVEDRRHERDVVGGRRLDELLRLVGRVGVGGRWSRRRWPRTRTATPRGARRPEPRGRGARRRAPSTAPTRGGPTAPVGRAGSRPAPPSRRHRRRRRASPNAAAPTHERDHRAQSDQHPSAPPAVAVAGRRTAVRRRLVIAGTGVARHQRAEVLDVDADERRHDHPPGSGVDRDVVAHGQDDAARRSGGRHAGRRVLDGDAIDRVDTEGGGGPQVGLGVRLAAVDRVAGDHGLERARGERLGHRVDQAAPRHRDERARHALLDELVRGVATRPGATGRAAARGRSRRRADARRSAPARGRRRRARAARPRCRAGRSR